MSRILLLLVLATAACGSAEARSTVAVRDSAGVRIVEEHAPSAESGVYQVGEEPSVQVGVAEGAPEYQLSGVRGIVRLADGGIVVANGLSHELRWYDAGGRFVRAAGRKGGGPGEFMSLDGVVAYRGDSLAVWDMGPRRISVFAPDGTLGRIAHVTGMNSLAARVAASFPDGSFLLAGVGSIQDYLRTDLGERRDSVTYLRMVADGSFADTLARQGSLEYVTARAGNHIMLQPVLFGRDSYVASGNGRTYVAESDRFRIDVLDPRGQVVQSIRRAGDLARPSREQLAAARRLAADARSAQQRPSDPPVGSAQAIPERPTVPALDRMIVDAHGHLWVREFLVDPQGAPRWSVYDANGAHVATAQTPAGLEIHQIGPDWILGVATDDMDVELVRIYPLRRPQRA